jgi:hypothetical protein
MTDLERRFHRAMLASYEAAKRECGYNPGYFLRMLGDMGGLAAAKQLLATDKPSEGFTTLWLARRLDLSVEAEVVKPEFAELFTAEEIATAKRRLQEVGYKVKG